MVRPTLSGTPSCSSSPHPRGDGPDQRGLDAPRRKFSPPAWGWSVTVVPVAAPILVLPTRVGMVRDGASMALTSPRSPHPRGDGPHNAVPAAPTAMFSPPAWGWSVPSEIDRYRQTVLPTRVGMVRAPAVAGWGGSGSPHPRGDGPVSPCTSRAMSPFSPPAWGWSDRHRVLEERHPVLPTRVGMVRRCWRFNGWLTSSPHPRGDGPIPSDPFGSTNLFSPPAWGWSFTLFSPPAWGSSGGILVGTNLVSSSPWRWNGGPSRAGPRLWSSVRLGRGTGRRNRHAEDSSDPTMAPPPSALACPVAPTWGLTLGRMNDVPRAGTLA